VKEEDGWWVKKKISTEEEKKGSLLDKKNAIRRSQEVLANGDCPRSQFDSTKENSGNNQSSWEKERLNYESEKQSKARRN